jgi:hypothetical protein
LQELFDVEDARMCTRHPLTYMHADETVSVAELEDRSRKYSEIVVGYLDKDNVGTITVNQNAKVKYGDVSRLIVMTSSCART